MWKSSYTIYCFTETCSYVCASNFFNKGPILMCFTLFESSWSPLSDGNVKFDILYQCRTLSWFSVVVGDGHRKVYSSTRHVDVHVQCHCWRLASSVVMKQILFISSSDEVQDECALILTCCTLLYRSVSTQ